jgi:glutathione S-transferase
MSAHASGRYTLIIGNRNYSSWSLRAWLFLAHHGLPFDEVRIPLFDPDSRARLLEHAPTGKVPVLRDGDVRVWESIAILEYLAERHPACGGWPADRTARAHARAIAAEMHAGFVPLRSNCPMNVRRTFAPRAWPEDVQRDVARIDAMWTDCRARFGAGGPFLFGAFGIADCMYAPVVWRLHGYGHALSAPAAAYVTAMLALPAMRRWHEASVAETEVLARIEAAGGPDRTAG